MEVNIRKEYKKRAVKVKDIMKELLLLDPEMTVLVEGNEFFTDIAVLEVLYGGSENNIPFLAISPRMYNSDGME